MTTNPMMQKNPLMSAWLSAANASAGAGRGLWMAEMRRQQAAMRTRAGLAAATSVAAGGVMVANEGTP